MKNIYQHLVNCLLTHNTKTANKCLFIVNKYLLTGNKYFLTDVNKHLFGALNGKWVSKFYLNTFYNPLTWIYENFNRSCRLIVVV